MKKILMALILLFIFSVPTHADYTEKVRVIKFDKIKHDLVIERINGEKLLLQHHHICGSYTTEFPIYLIWSDDVIVKLKVAANEICDVYNYGSYSSDIIINKIIKSDNLLVDDHLAEIVWRGSKYEIDYGEGCEHLWEFDEDLSYISSNNLNGATLYLAGNRGQCKIKSAGLLEVIDAPDSVIDSPITNIQHKAENNQAYFYWDKDENNDWLYMISRSRYQLNPDDYHWRQMPFLRMTRENSYTAKALANNRTYYFYFSARDEEGNVAPWRELKVTPILTRFVYQNNPDPEEFEVEVTEETDAYYLLRWPDKSENSRRYLIQFFVNGARKIFDIISTETNEFLIPKKPEYEGAGFRFEVRSIPKEIFGARHKDAIYWRAE